MNTQLLNSKIIYFRPKFALPNFLILKVGFIIIGVIISEVAVPSVISVDGSDVVGSRLAEQLSSAAETSSTLPFRYRQPQAWLEG